MSDKIEIRPFTRSQMRRAEHDYTRHAVDAPEGYEPEHSFRTETWALVAEVGQIRVRDEIRVTAHDLSWVQRLVVVFSKGSVIHVAQESLNKLERGTTSKKIAAEEMKDRYIVKHQGFGKWGVFDTQGKTEGTQWIEKDMSSKEIAQEALKNLMEPA